MRHPISTSGRAATARIFHASEDLWAKVERIARARGISMSKLIRESLGALPEPKALPGEACSVCQGTPAAFHRSDGSVLCSICERKRKDELVKPSAKFGVSVAVIVGLFSLCCHGDNLPRLETVPPSFGYADSGAVVFQPYLIRNAGVGKLWGSIRRTASCGDGYSLVLPEGRKAYSIHYILGEGQSLVAVVRYAPRKDGAQVCAFTVGQGGDK